MSQFSDIVKEAQGRFPSYRGKRSHGGGHFGGSPSKPEVVEFPNKRSRGPDAAVRISGKSRGPSLGDDVFKRWGGSAAAPEPGVKFDAVTGTHVPDPKFTKVERIKQILGSRAAKRIGLYGLGAAGVVGAVAGIDALRNALDKRVGKEKAFKNMIKDNPSLAHSDPVHVKKVFNTLYTFNKDMAKDPLVAGSFTRRSLMFKDEGIQPMDVKTLTEIRKNMRDGKGGSPTRDIIGDLGTIGGLARFVG